jgi:hypothetical protein
MPRRSIREAFPLLHNIGTLLKIATGREKASLAVRLVRQSPKPEHLHSPRCRDEAGPKVPLLPLENGLHYSRSSCA